MVLFTATQNTLSSPGEPNYGFEDVVRIELGVPRILTTGIILTISSFTWFCSELIGYEQKFRGSPDPC